MTSASSSLPQLALLGDGDALLAQQRRHRGRVAVVEEIDAGVLPQGVAHRQPPPGRREVQLLAADAHRGRAQRLPRDRRHEVLDHPRDVVVVGVGLVRLEHRELGVVPGRDALVAEDAAQLVDAVEPADDEALEVQLQRDAQVALLAERVEVRREGARRRAAGLGLQDRRLDLQEAARLHEAPHRRDDARSLHQHGPRVLVGLQVEVAPAVARLHVLQAVELLGRRPQRLGQQPQFRRIDRHLARARAEHRPGRLDEVAQVEGGQQGPAVAQLVAAAHELHRARAVAQVEEGQLAQPSQVRDPARDPRRWRLRVRAARLERLEARARLGDARERPPAPRGVGIDAGRAQRVGLLEALPAQFPQALAGLAGLGAIVRHGTLP